MNCKIIQKQERIIQVSGKHPCPFCGETAPSEIYYEDGFSYLEITCLSEKRSFRYLLGKDFISGDWLDIAKSWPQRIIKDSSDYLKDGEDDKKSVQNQENAQTVFFYITSRCNAACKICDVYNKMVLEMSLDTFKKRLKKYKNKNIIFMGGEPTVREDLPQFIYLAKQAGNSPVLFTNGLKLADRDYLKELKAQGLTIVYFSFDSFSPSYYRTIRGDEKVLPKKLKALDNLEKENMETILNVTLVKGYNDQEVLSIIDFALKHKNIQEIIFNSVCLYGRETGPSGSLTKENLLSRSEMIADVAQSLNISEEFFNIWNDIKIKSLLLVEKLFPYLPLPIFWSDAIYLKREGARLSSLMSLAGLQRIRRDLNTGGLKALWGLFKLIFKVFPSAWHSIIYYNSERKFLKKNSLFKVAVISSSLPKRFVTGEAPLIAIGEKEQNSSLYKPDSYMLFDVEDRLA